MNVLLIQATSVSVSSRNSPDVKMRVKMLLCIYLNYCSILAPPTIYAERFSKNPQICRLWRKFHQDQKLHVVDGNELLTKSRKRKYIIDSLFQTVTASLFASNLKAASTSCHCFFSMAGCGNCSIKHQIHDLDISCPVE